MKKQELKVKSPYMIAVWPGIGDVALLAITYLKERLKVQEIAEIEPYEFFDPTGVVVNSNIVETPKFPKSRFYLWTKKGAKHDIVFFLGEAQPTLKSYNFAQKVVEVAKKLKVKRIYTCAAAVVRMPYAQTPKVWAVATHPSLVEELKKYDVEMKGDFIISGLNGLLLGVAKEQGLDGVCLLGEVPFYASRVENPRASLAVLQVLTQMLGVEVNLEELEKQAKEADEKMEQLAKEAMTQFIDQYTKPLWQQEEEGR